VIERDQAAEAGDAMRHLPERAARHPAHHNVVDWLPRHKIGCVVEIDQPACFTQSR
jgi:hypothetical protein